MKLSRVEAASKERANVRSTRHCTVATLPPFVGADGRILPSVYILKARFRDGDGATVNFSMKDAPSITQGTWPRFYCWTDTGYLDADTLEAILKKVADVWHTQYPGIPAILFNDQLAVHRRVLRGVTPAAAAAAQAAVAATAGQPATAGAPGGRRGPG